MESRYRSGIKEVTDQVFLSLVSGGSAEHDHENRKPSNKTNALHSSWVHIETGILNSIGYSCSYGNFYDGNSHSGGIGYGGSAGRNSNGSNAGSSNCNSGGVAGTCNR